MTRTGLRTAKAASIGQLKLNRLVLSLLASLLLAVAVPGAHATTTTITDLGYVNTWVQTPSQRNIANCPSDCWIHLATLDVPCESFGASTCTFYIHVTSEVQLSAGDAGRFRFKLDDGLNNNQILRPTAPDGTVTWLASDPDSPGRYATSFAVVGTADNDPYNPNHTIEILIGCGDTDGSGSCAVTSFFSSVEVRVYTPY